MRNRSWKGIRTLLPLVVLLLGGVDLVAGESTVSGRLTDPRGAALPGATVLVFPVGSPDGPGGCAAPPLAPRRQDEIGPPCASLRTDRDGGFVALLPPGRYRVAAIKAGYEVSITEVHSLASRVLRLRLEPEHGGNAPPRPGQGRGLDWALRPKPDDILRSEDAALPTALVAVAAAPATPETAGSLTTRSGAGPLGTLDGEVTQSVTAGDLPGVASASVGDAGWATTLAVRAPVDERLAWSLGAASARAQSGLGRSDAAISGATDRIVAGAAYRGGAAAGLAGSVRAGAGRSVGGSAEIRDRLLAASGSVRAWEHADPIDVALQAWSSDADLGGGGFVTFDGVAAGSAAEPSGAGVSLYAGSRHAFGAATSMRYGVEYRGDNLGGPARVVPRVGMSRAVAGPANLAVEGEILLDPGSPGGRVGVACGTAATLKVAAMVEFMPEFAPVSTMSAPMAEAVTCCGTAPSAGRRSLDVSLARDFGPLGGSVAGSLGRTDRRSLPAIEDGPMPIVALAAERYYETRLGVAWRPWRTEMQVGYRRVEAEAPVDGDAGGDYTRLDLMVSQGLPAPHALDGARLRALLAWQAVAYDALLAGAGAPVSGLASRLSGGVGLSF